MSLGRPHRTYTRCDNEKVSAQSSSHYTRLSGPHSSCMSDRNTKHYTATCNLYYRSLTCLSLYNTLAHHLSIPVKHLHQVCDHGPYLYGVLYEQHYWCAKQANNMISESKRRKEYKICYNEERYILFTHQQMHFLLNLEKFKFTWKYT